MRTGAQNYQFLLEAMFCWTGLTPSGHQAHFLLSIKAKGKEFSRRTGELGTVSGGATMPFQRPLQGGY